MNSNSQSAEDGRSFDLTELILGFPLKFDIKRTSGELLAKRGDIVSAELIQQWAELGITQAVIAADGSLKSTTAVGGRDAVSSVESGDQQLASLLRPYDQDAILRISENYLRASEAMLKISDQLLSGDLSDCHEVAGSVKAFIDEIESDTAAVLASLFDPERRPPTERDVQLSQRSARMAVMATAVAAGMGHSREDCQTVGLAGMLHDISLFDQASRDDLVKTSFEHLYFEHPLLSAGLLTYIVGITDQIRHIITQVHEELDGHGFPRGLFGTQINRYAKILSIVDVYLTLTATEQPAPLPKGSNLVPADAIAYLLQQTKLGRFDVQAMRGVVAATSLYPVGTKVALDDQTLATVLRSSSSPSQPIVRLDAGKGEIVDLRDSHLAIEKPAPSGAYGAMRIKTSQLDQILWR